MVEGPASRVRNAKALWRFLESHEPALRERVRERVPGGLIAEIEGAPRGGWLAMERDRDFVLGIIGAVGSEEEAIQLWRAFAQRWKDEPMVKPIYEACVRVFGLDVLAFSRILARFYSTEYRGMGHMEAIQQDDDSMVVVIDQMPDPMFEGNAYVTVFKGMFEGMCDIALSPGPRVTTIASRPKGVVQVVLEGIRSTRLRRGATAKTK